MIRRASRSSLAVLAVVGLLTLATGAQAAPPRVSLTGAPTPESASPQATFTFTSASPSAVFECRVDEAGFAPCVSPLTLNALSLGRHAFEVRATDPTEGPGIAATYAWTVLEPAAIVSSLVPPPVPKNVRAVAGDRLVRLTWQKPSSGVRAVVVTAAAGDTPPRVVFRGPGSGTTLHGLRNGVPVRLSLRTIDGVGNESREIFLDATPMPPFVAFPANRAKVTTAPVLRWNDFQGARYFNVQLFRGSRKVLSAWPLSTRLRLERGWIYNGRWQTLRPGLYTWYVWPGLGARTDAKYGPLLGKQTFVVS